MRPVSAPTVIPMTTAAATPATAWAHSGHPFGSTGARITTTLLNGLQARDAQYGLETMCVGGGQGMAIIFERLS